MNSNQTKNDVAWIKLFEQYQILDKVKHSGEFVISSAQINQVRESRLMAKFDHLVNLPEPFRRNNLSILPISRSHYVIGPFKSHRKLTYTPDIAVVPKQLPDGIESIDYANLYSEAAALNCAYNAGIIDDLVGERTLHTVSGRMSTSKFSFSIDGTTAALPPGSSSFIEVDNSQCEIDAGFEGAEHFVLVEAKLYKVDDFLVRQLYYPYRLWSGKLSKRVVPVLMTFSSDTFDFFIYAFRDSALYNSLELIEQRSYAIAPETIKSNDIASVLAQTQVGPEPANVPFPQADDFARVLDLLSLLASTALTRDDITENYEFDSRQTSYYTDAARYLGLVDKFTDPATHEVIFQLSDDGRAVLKQRPKQKVLELVGKILERNVFNTAFRLLQRGTMPTNDDISQIIADCHIAITGSTVGRRASSVRGWIKWIWDQVDE